MNYLAHLHLSGDDPELLVGNYMGDGVRSSQLPNLPARMQVGVRLHRLIDEYTDSHDIVKESVNRLRPRCGKYASVVVDIVYDHFLCVNWNLYNEQPIQEFADNVYQLLLENEHHLPDKSAMFMRYMIHHNILVQYKHDEALEQVLKGMTRRSRHNDNMYKSMIEIVEHREEFASEFEQFYPELQKQVELFKTNENI